jgi:hypothetical protein
VLEQLVAVFERDDYITALSNRVNLGQAAG